MSKLKLEYWNPSVKMITVLVCVLLLSFQYFIILNLTVFAAALLLVLFFSEARVKRVAAILVPASVAAFGLFMMGLYYARGSAVDTAALRDLSAAPYIVRAAMSRNLHTALQLSTRLLAFAGLGILFALTTDGELFMASLIHQCHLSPKFAYGVLAALHLLPNMTREFKAVRTAFAVRGIHVGAFSMKPVFTMLVNSIRWSEELAMAMESRGFCGTAPRTYHLRPRVKAGDILMSILWIGGILLGMIILI